MRFRGTSFSLLEVVVTVGVLTVLFLGVSSTMVMSMQARNFSRERDIAREAARAKLESILELPLTAIFALDGTTFNAPNTSAGANADFPTAVANLQDPLAVLTCPPGQVGFPAPGLVTVQNTPAPLSADLMRVIVEVRWVGTDGSPNRVELSTLVSEKG